MVHGWKLGFVVGVALMALAIGGQVLGQEEAATKGPDHHVLPGHKSVVSEIAWSADGRTLLAADPEVWRVWDVKTRKVLRSRGWVGFEEHPTLSPDGKQFATTVYGGLLQIYQTSTAKLLCSARFGKGMLGRAAWSPDGKRIAIASEHGGAIIDAASGKRLLRFDSGDDYLVTVAWSPDGRRLATGGTGNVLRIWSAAGKPLEKLVVEPHLKSHSSLQMEPRWSDTVHSVVWNPNGDTVAGAYEDGTVRIWNPSTDKVEVLTAHELLQLPDPLFGAFYSGVKDLAWSPDGRRLATIGGDGAVHVWRPGEATADLSLLAFPRTVRKNDRFEGGATAVSWSPDGKWLAVGGWSSELQLWKIDPIAELR